MVRKQGMAAVLLVALGILLAVAAFWPSLAAFDGGLRLDQAMVQPPSHGEPMTVQLPHTWPARTGDATFRYTVRFAGSSVEADPLYLYIPLLSQRAAVELNGTVLTDTGNRSLPTGIISGVTTLVRLPADRLVPGVNTLDVSVSSSGVIRGHLAPLFLGSVESLGPHYRLSLFLLEHVRLMVMAAQLLLVVAVLVVWLYRPREPLFFWLLVAQALSLPLYVGLRADLPGVQEVLPYVLMASSSATFILPIIALLLNGARVPRWLVLAVVAVPCLGIALAVASPWPAQQVMRVLSIPAAVFAVCAAAVISLFGALRGLHESRLLLLPLGMFAIAMLHDVAQVAGRIDSPLLLGAYCRMLLMIGIAVILMRRMGLGLMRLDGANVHLRSELAQREEELARLHAQEHREAADRVRREERQRLMVDLHDGVSGHLASIIALAEREESAVIESSAREALDDLRLVIHSLDIGDRDLPVALAGLRERVARQLKRVGVELEWSMLRLPEVSGVTPTQALHVLRVVQEAITNALRHGPATRITVRGEPHGTTHARIVVENDGAAFAQGQGGAGLGNMRRRAELLGGALHCSPLEAGSGARIQLCLPLNLSSQSMLYKR
jgi:two-component system sensor histidine kinase UhpB